MPALKSALVKLKPRSLSAESGDVRDRGGGGPVDLAFRARRCIAGAGTASVAGQIAAWLWFTVYFANFAEAIAEGRGKARADTLRATQTETPAKRLASLAAVETETVSSRDAQRRAISYWSRPATSSRPTARWSRASPRSTNPRSPASPRR